MRRILSSTSSIFCILAIFGCNAIIYENVLENWYAKLYKSWKLKIKYQITAENCRDAWQAHGDHQGRIYEVTKVNHVVRVERCTVKFVRNEKLKDITTSCYFCHVTFMNKPSPNSLFIPNENPKMSYGVFFLSRKDTIHGAFILKPTTTFPLHKKINSDEIAKMKTNLSVKDRVIVI